MVRPFYRNLRLLILTIILIVVWGIASFQSLPRQEDPDLISRVAVVKTAFPGASADRVEALVTEVLEAEISEVEGVKTLESNSRVGFSSVQVELLDEITDPQPLWSKVRDELDDAAVLFPPGVGAPELDEIKIKAYTLIVGITWELPTPANEAVLRRYAEELEVVLRGVAGTAEVEKFGEPTEEILVEINAEKLAAVGLSPQTLAAQVGLSDAKVSAGQLRSRQQDLAIEVTGELETLGQISQIPIQNSAGQFTRLSDVAQVSRGIRQPPQQLAVISGKPAVVLGVLMQSGLRIDQWTVTMQERLAEFQSRAPAGISIDVIFDQSDFVNQRIGSLLSNLILGAGLVVIVTLLSMGWRSSLIVGSALPLVTMAVLGWMAVFGIAMQQMSITGLIIALGLLIDNAIIVVDEIHAEMQAGAKPVAAVTKSVKYLQVPLLASTLTTVLTFLPIYLLPGPAGEFVGSIALSVIFALISSLVLSLTVIAALAGRMLARSRSQGQQLAMQHDTRHLGRKIQAFLLRPGAWWNEGFSSPRLGRWYRNSLAWVTRNPRTGIALTLIIPLIGFLSAGTLDRQFFPLLSREQIQIEVEFAPQTAIATTQAQTETMRDVILDYPKVEAVHWFIGESAPKFYYNLTGSRQNQANYAQAIVQLKTGQGLNQIVQDLQKQLDNQFPAARVIVQQLQQGPPYDAPIEMRIMGSNLDTLRELGMEVREILSQVPDVVYARDDLSEVRPKLMLSVDEEQAQQVGLSNSAIAQQLSAYLEGATGGSILEATEELPVRVRITDTARGNISDISALNLRPEQATDRAFRPTSALGDFSLVPERANIARRNEERVNTVQGFITAGVLPSVVLNNFQAALEEANFALPPGYRYEYGGEQAESSQAVGNLLTFVPLLVILMISALVLSLGSFRQALIIAAVAVGSVGMALFSLRVFGAILGFMAIIGSMGLVGIAINDSVIVLSALNDNPDAKAGKRDAIIRVVIKATRHVVTTTITTIAGFVPLLVSGGVFWQPLAIAIAGGISGSSILALYFVPTVYYLIYRGKSQPTPSSPKQLTQSQT